MLSKKSEGKNVMRGRMARMKMMIMMAIIMMRMTRMKYKPSQIHTNLDHQHHCSLQLLLLAAGLQSRRKAHMTVGLTARHFQAPQRIYLDLGGDTRELDEQEMMKIRNGEVISRIERQ